METQDHEGTVKWFNVEKGFGFIARDDGTDFYVHYSDIPANRKNRHGFRYLRTNERVRFDIAASNLDRVKAANIRLIG
ncbi:cold-shock protein [Nocardia sp. NPDC050408]|uniref:cold-shock protein n=1 Tax=Nocardia sp. NPDC050408 TaxID=3364319 RepID=UPI0037BA29A1